MKARSVLVAMATVLLVCGVNAKAAEEAAPPSAIAQDAPAARFAKQVLTDKYFCDGITAGDFNRDGRADIVAGPFWYAGPDFKTRHEFYPAKEFPTEPSPTDSMFSYVHDFNGDGWPDILVLGRVHLHQAFWYENPQGKPGLWKKHFAFHRVQGESPPFLDVDGDGRPELVAHWQNCWGFIQPDWTEPAKEWAFKPVTAEGKFHHFYHGTGIGDVNGDGRPDLILNEAWYEQPADKAAEWTRHEFRFAEKGGAQMFAYDVDGDGDNDIITALDAHGWGLAWFEHVKQGGGITFHKHVIMGSREEEAQFGVAFSQPHALALADVDGDGLLDIVTGKRRWAHGPKGDVEPMADPVVYWFQLVREKGKARFVPRLIDKESGVGCQVTAADVNGDGRPDILTVSKLGAFVFLNSAQAASAAALPAAGAMRAAEPYFPPPESKGGWRKLEKPEDVRKLAGMDPDKLAELKEWLLQSDKRDFAAVVIRNGYIVLEVERGNNAKTDARRVASVSKAVCATVLAIASEQSQQGKTPRKMKFDDPAFDFIPWAQPLSDPRKAKITVKQLLNHTSGICPEALKPNRDTTWGKILGHTDDAVAAKLAFDPGTASGYSTHALDHASLVCETVTGKPYDRFAIENLFQPIGVEKWTFQYFEGGEKIGKHPSHGLGMPARDLARIAYCMQRGGRWESKQVIPKWFVDETAAPTHDVEGDEMRFKRNAQSFSHGWELPALLATESVKGIPKDARYKPGSGGQLIAFVPSLDLVITRQTGASGQWEYEEYLRRACDAVLP